MEPQKTTLFSTNKNACDVIDRVFALKQKIWITFTLALDTNTFQELVFRRDFVHQNVECQLWSKDHSTVSVWGPEVTRYVAGSPTPELHFAVITSLPVFSKTLELIAAGELQHKALGVYANGTTQEVTPTTLTGIKELFLYTHRTHDRANYVVLEPCAGSSRDTMITVGLAHLTRRNVSLVKAGVFENNHYLMILFGETVLQCFQKNFHVSDMVAKGELWLGWLLIAALAFNEYEDCYFDACATKDPADIKEG